MAEIVSLADYRRETAEAHEQPTMEQGEALRLLLLRDISRRLGLMPYDQWVAAGRPEGK